MLNRGKAAVGRFLVRGQSEWQSNESWLDIYQHPIENMWRPDEINNDSDDDDDEDNDDDDDEDNDDDEDVEVRSHDSPIEESEEDAEPSVARRGANEMNSEQRRSGRDPHDQDDEKIE
jgi:hypothetical protein